MKLFILSVLLLTSDGPSSVVLSGVDVVTLGILYSFQCSASCYPACQFTWTWGNVTSQGPELSLQLTELQAAQNLTCTAVNPVTKTAAAAQKMLQAAGSDSKIQFDLVSCLSSNNFKQMFFIFKLFSRTFKHTDTWPRNSHYRSCVQLHLLGWVLPLLQLYMESWLRWHDIQYCRRKPGFHRSTSQHSLWVSDLQSSELPLTSLHLHDSVSAGGMYVKVFKSAS